ncbi:HAMP domain-containing protein [Babesia caballi]|uniref:HAMP domain-containing protein n=1 Tax=Babesia caballi TaxID=5871 RepID=A0AAV4LPE8_BABCB|nr:HAMP domain-containing protein [Babesia caballi]
MLNGSKRGSDVYDLFTMIDGFRYVDSTPNTFFEFLSEVVKETKGKLRYNPNHVPLAALYLFTFKYIRNSTSSIITISETGISTSDEELTTLLQNLSEAVNTPELGSSTQLSYAYTKLGDAITVALSVPDSSEESSVAGPVSGAIATTGFLGGGSAVYFNVGTLFKGLLLMLSLHLRQNGDKTGRKVKVCLVSSNSNDYDAAWAGSRGRHSQLPQHEVCRGCRTSGLSSACRGQVILGGDPDLDDGGAVLAFVSHDDLHGSQTQNAAVNLLALRLLGHYGLVQTQQLQNARNVAAPEDGVGVEEKEGKTEAENVGLAAGHHAPNVSHDVLERKYVHVHTDEPLGAEGFGDQKALDVVVQLLVALLQQFHEHACVAHVGFGHAGKVPAQLVLVEVHDEPHDVVRGQKEGKEGDDEALALVVAAEDFAVLLGDKRALGVQAEDALVLRCHLEAGLGGSLHGLAEVRRLPDVAVPQERDNVVHEGARDVGGGVFAADQRLHLRAEGLEVLQGVESAAAQQGRLPLGLPKLVGQHHPGEASVAVRGRTVWERR